ncbi:tuberoinfundibular peptide of 39 residues [Monodelphis domestica]|uniref:tuberoinfundibular peptide of 39 residues n=1 Tax=Monodelphis domestica TaxID=13616 RepID=UPI0024E1B2D8|nr:tuberoinfundibular peptide of 39 residues [Monodelphis domestica]
MGSLLRLRWGRWEAKRQSSLEGQPRGAGALPEGQGRRRSSGDSNSSKKLDAGSQFCLLAVALTELLYRYWALRRASRLLHRIIASPGRLVARSASSALCCSLPAVAPNEAGGGVTLRPRTARACVSTGLYKGFGGGGDRLRLVQDRTRPIMENPRSPGHRRSRLLLLLLLLLAPGNPAATGAAVPRPDRPSPWLPWAPPPASLTLRDWSLQMIREAGPAHGPRPQSPAVAPSAGPQRRLVVADDAAFRERARLLAALERRRWLNSYMQKLLVVSDAAPAPQ